MYSLFTESKLSFWRWCGFEEPVGGDKKIKGYQTGRAGIGVGSVPADDRVAGKWTLQPSIILAFKIARYFRMSIEDIFIYEEEGV